MAVPFDELASFKSSKVVRAGEITEVVPAGCYVRNADGESSILRIYEENMTARYQPKVGDYWIVYPDGYQSLSPREAFEDGYTRI